MMMTNELTKALELSDKQNVVLDRKYGVIKQIILPVDLVPIKSNVFSQLSINVGDRTATLVEAPNVITAYTEQIGIIDNSDIQVVFITNNRALVTLKKGSLAVYAKEKGIIAYENTGAARSVHIDAIRWVTVKDLYDAVAYMIEKKYNTLGNKTCEYIYNMTVSYNCTYTRFNRDKAEHSMSHTGYDEYKCKVTNASADMSCGAFEFVVLESQDKGKKLGYLQRRSGMGAEKRGLFAPYVTDSDMKPEMLSVKEKKLLNSNNDSDDDDLDEEYLSDEELYDDDIPEEDIYEDDEAEYEGEEDTYEDIDTSGPSYDDYSDES